MLKPCTELSWVRKLSISVFVTARAAKWLGSGPTELVLLSVDPGWVVLRRLAGRLATANLGSLLTSSAAIGMLSLPPGAWIGAVLCSNPLLLLSPELTLTWDFLREVLSLVMDEESKLLWILRK